MMMDCSVMNPGYRKRTIILLIVLLLVRFWYGQTFELSGREAYLWLEGHGVNLSPGYWERGPLVPFLIRVGTLFFGDTELGVRWLSAVIACLTGFTLFLSRAALVQRARGFLDRGALRRRADVRVEAFVHDRGDGGHRADGAGPAWLLPRRSRRTSWAGGWLAARHAGWACLSPLRMPGGWLGCCSTSWSNRGAVRGCASRCFGRR